MNDWFILLAAIGVVFILKYGKPTEFLRNFAAKWENGKLLFSCGMCLGFWVGVLFAPIYGWTLKAALFPFVCSISSYMMDSVNQLIWAGFRKLEEKS